MVLARRVFSDPLLSQLVTSMETNPELDKELHGWDMEEVRANEKKLMQYNRDMAAVSKGENTIHKFVEILFPCGRQRGRWPWKQENARPA